MELSLKQAAMLAVISANPGITGPEILDCLGGLIPQIQFPQHVCRLRNRGLIRTEKCGSSTRTNRVYLTTDGEKELAGAREILQLVQKQLVKRPKVSNTYRR